MTSAPRERPARGASARRAAVYLHTRADPIRRAPRPAHGGPVAVGGAGPRPRSTVRRAGAQRRGAPAGGAELKAKLFRRARAHIRDVSAPAAGPDRYRIPRYVPTSVPNTYSLTRYPRDATSQHDGVPHTPPVCYTRARPGISVAPYSNRARYSRSMAMYSSQRALAHAPALS